MFSSKSASAAQPTKNTELEKRKKNAICLGSLDGYRVTKKQISIIKPLHPNQIDSSLSSSNSTKNLFTSFEVYVYSRKAFKNASTNLIQILLPKQQQQENKQQSQETSTTTTITKSTFLHIMANGYDHFNNNNSNKNYNNDNTDNLLQQIEELSFHDNNYNNKEEFEIIVPSSSEHFENHQMVVNNKEEEEEEEITFVKCCKIDCPEVLTMEVLTTEDLLQGEELEYYYFCKVKTLKCGRMVIGVADKFNVEIVIY
ncbi:hypothetical protein ABK040_000700 [Willaertia magna]